MVVQISDLDECSELLYKLTFDPNEGPTLMSDSVR